MVFFSLQWKIDINFINKCKNLVKIYQRCHKSTWTDMLKPKAKNENASKSKTAIN